MSGGRRALGRLAGAKLEIGLAALVVILFGDYLFSDRLLFGTDSIPGGLFFRGLLVDFVRAHGELPRWNPFILGGLPFLDATHGDTFFPTALLQFTMPVYRALGHKLLVHVFLGGVFMAFYLRSLALRPAAVAWGAVAYMLCPVFVSYLYAGQDGKMYVTSLAPLVLGLLERAMRSGSVRHFVGLGLALGLTILSSQIQMAYHLTWFLGALFVVRLVRGPAPVEGVESRPARRRLGVGFVGAIALGLLVAAVQLVPAVAYVKDPAGFSVRSDRTDYEHATSWSLHPEEVASMVVPEFCNAPRGYWGRNPFKLNSDFVGILPLFLAGVALRGRDATRWFLGGLAVFCVLYALGGHTPIHRLFYAVVPQVKLFRAPPLVMFGAAFGLCALAAHAIHDLGTTRSIRRGRGGAKEGGGPRERPLLVLALPFCAVLALAALAGSGVMSFWNDLLRPGLDEALRREQAANLPAFRTGALAGAALLAVGAALLDAWRRGGPWRKLAFAGLLLVTVVDAWRVDRRFVAVVDPRPFIEPSPLLARLQQESAVETFRVMPIARGLGENQMGYFGIESVLGFHDNELRWYREMRTEPAAQGFLAATASGYPFLRALNVKYVVHDQADLPNPYPVPGWLPRFRLVGDWEVAGEPAAIAARMTAEDFDPARTVILEEDPGLSRAPVPAGDAGEESGASEVAEPGRVLAWEYDGNEIRVEVEAERPCLLIHAENWFPYWHCTADGGLERPILRAYGMMRAVPLESGYSRLTFRFRSAPFNWGKRSTAVALLVALALLAAPRLSRGGRPA